MSPTSSVESSRQPSPLHPALQAALGSLDVQLDDELRRYRRYRAGKSRYSSSGLNQPQSSQALDPLAIAPETQAGEPSLPETPKSDASNAPDAPQIELPTSAPLSLSSEGSETGSDNRPGQTHATVPQLPLDADPQQTPPQDYLESTEELLKNLDDDEPARSPAPPPRNNSLLSPLGAGSILLFLLASATLGYVAISPSGLESLGLDRWFGSSESEESETAASDPVEPEQPPSELPTSPNLAAREFIELDVKNLGRLDPNPNAIQAPAANPPAQSNPQTPVTPPTPLPQASTNNTDSLDNLSSTLLDPTAGSEAQPEVEPVAPPPASPTTESDENAQTAPEYEPEPVQDDRYYDFYFVVAEYDSFADLQRARDVVPDAYLREFPIGARIQLGAIDDASGARGLVERLKDAGIEARVYRP